MKTYTDLKELLLDFSKYHWDETEPFNRPDHDKLVENYLSNNSLALGKPEPLAKNKQMQEYFCLNRAYGFEHSLCLKTQCGKCEKLGKEIRADATSR